LRRTYAVRRESNGSAAVHDAPLAWQIAGEIVMLSEACAPVMTGFETPKLAGYDAW
jgi:hypothetical protein